MKGKSDAGQLEHKALTALRSGDYDFALRAVERGDATVPSLVEDLKIYQAELEIQNQELREAQIRAQQAVDHFSRLFNSLPLPALLINELGVIKDFNASAEHYFRLPPTLLRSHYLPRLIKTQEHLKLHAAIEEAKTSGRAEISSIAMRIPDASAHVADLHLSLFYPPGDESAHFVVMCADQTVRIEQQEQLRQEQRHFMAYFDSSPVGMASTSPDKRWLEVNNTLCQLLEYGRDELMTMTWEELTHPDDLQEDMAQFNRVMSGEIDSYELDKRFIRKHGVVLEAHIATRCVRDEDGAVDYFVAIVESIEARRQAERKLEQSNAGLFLAQATLTHRVNQLKAIYAISKKAQIASTQEELLDEIRVQLPSGMTCPDDTSVGIELRDSRFQSGPCGQCSDKLVSEILIGSEVVGHLAVGYVSDRVVSDCPPFSPEEQDLVNGVAIIISRFLRLQKEKAARLLELDRSRFLLELLASSADLPEKDLLIRALDGAEHLTHSSFAYVHFVNEDQKTIRLGAWLSKTAQACEPPHGSHCPISSAGVWADSLRQGASVIHNDSPSLPDNKGLPDGPPPVLRHMSVPVLKNENVVMIVGVGNKAERYDDSDLTVLELVANNIWSLIERNRQQAELKLNAEVFEISQEGVLITDENRTILSVNKAFTRITGYSAEEAIGQTPGILKSGKQSPEFYQTMWKEIDKTGNWQGEIWNRRKNGEVFPQWLGISASRKSDGSIARYVGIFADIGAYKAAEAKIHHLAFYDPLTGLPNRRLLIERANQALSMAKRQVVGVAVMYLDLDGFKDINDVLGHSAGDQLLLEVSRRITSCVRSGDTVCRIGGDEFVILLYNAGDAIHVADIAQKVLQRVSLPIVIKDNHLQASCSIGASLYPEDGETIEVLLQHADTAMYEAKKAGKNTFRLFTESMNQQLVRRHFLQDSLRNALFGDELFLEYQPQYDLHSLRIIGAEALLRWRHPEKGLISPADFIRVAEQSDLILQVGRFVLSSALKQAKTWLKQGHRISISVNISVKQVFRDDLVTLVTELLEKFDFPPNLLELELTESILADDPLVVLNLIEQLKAHGVRFSIDDFGTGYSSLSYLKRFPVSKLKIDQSFVHDLLVDEDDKVIVTAITALAKSLSLTCIAEGVENNEQATLLREMGCDQIQGYWLAKPLSAEKMEAMLELHADVFFETGLS